MANRLVATQKGFKKGPIAQSCADAARALFATARQVGRRLNRHIDNSHQRRSGGGAKFGQRLCGMMRGALRHDAIIG